MNSEQLQMLEDFKALREKFAERIFGKNNKIKDNANSYAKRMYYIYDAKVKRLNAIQYQEICATRKIQTEAKLHSMGYRVGDAIQHIPSNTTGILVIDNYGYATLKTGEAEDGSLLGRALYEHSIKECRKIGDILHGTK